MPDNINILTNELAAAQKNYYLIRNINVIHDKIPNINVQVFTENLSRPCLKTNFAVMNISEAWGQHGNFISTNLSTTAKMLKYPCAKRKLFYIWDLEFIRPSNRFYNNYAPIYTNSNLELVCRSKEHARLVENAFNRDVKYIVHNFDIRNFIEIFDEAK